MIILFFSVLFFGLRPLRFIVMLFRVAIFEDISCTLGDLYAPFV